MIQQKKDTRDYYWDISEINNQNDRLDIALGINHIENATQNNFINGNWYYNQYDSNFNAENENTRFIYQQGFQSQIRYITGLTFARINTTSGKKDIVVSQGDTMYVFENSSGSITTSDVQQFNFACHVQASGKFTTDDAEDVAVHRNDSIFIFKGIGNASLLDSVPAFKMDGAAGGNVKFILAQVNSWIEPYATIQQTTSNRDEIVMRQGDSITIFINNNNNGISSYFSIGSLASNVDFKLADVNKDGFNDLVTSSLLEGIKIFLNTAGSIDATPDYTNDVIIRNPSSIDVADFNKDGWNDIVAATNDSIKIWLNTKQSGLFPQTVSYALRYDIELYPLFGSKLLVRDLHNKGGLSLVFSGFRSLAAEKVEIIYRFNPITLDADPAPAYLFDSYVNQSGVYRPKLLLFNRGDRDFQKYKIYKKSWNTSYIFILWDSTANSSYIDTTEALILSAEGESGPPDNCFYYVKAQDNSYKVSVNSDTIAYSVYICPTCPHGPDNPSFNEPANSEIPKEYSITNFPNPFNPSTKIYFTLPKEGIVKLTVYNSLGQIVAELINEFKEIGSYYVRFDGSNLSSGIYFYKLEAGNIVATKRMLLLK